MTLWTSFGRNDIFAIMSLLVHKHYVSHHLCVASVTSLNFILQFFSVETFAYFITFIPGCLVVFFCYYKWHYSLKFIFYLLTAGTQKQVNLCKKKKKTKLEYYHFAMPSELMYLGIDQQQLFSSVQLLSCVGLFVTPWTAALQASLSITNSQNLLKLMSIESVMPSNHLILCRPFLLPPSIFPSIRVFPNESALHIRRSKYWTFYTFYTYFL